jgi:hypothetical protein
MGRIETRLPKGGTLILLWIGVIVLLGAVGWGIGWLAPRVLAPRETPTPTQAAGPTSAPTSAPTTVSTAPQATAAPPTPAGDGAPVDDSLTGGTLPAATPEGAEPTSEPPLAPTTVPAPAAGGSEVVQSGDGLFQVCRRHCPERWPPDDDALPVYAQQVAELNGLSWPDPALSLEQTLEMPPCPER